MEPTIRRHRNHVIELRPSRAVARPSPASPTTAPGFPPVAASPPEPAPIEVLIDGEPVGHGRLADGSLYMDENAYEWGDDLAELAEKLIDYRDRTQAAQGRSGPEA
jgi:hypothetical protein